MNNGEFDSRVFDPIDAFVDFCKIGDKWFPFSAVREYRVEDKQLAYSGKRIITLINDKLGTVCFKMVAYKDIFLPESSDDIATFIDRDVIDAIGDAIKRHE